MSWVTVILSMSASACLTLAAIYWLVWYQNRAGWANLLFSATAASTTAFTFCELWLMRVTTPEELVNALKWAQLPLSFWLVSTTWLVWAYLGAGRRWLAWTITAMRVVYVVLTFMTGQLQYLEVPNLQRIRVFGETVSILQGGTTNPIVVFGQFSVVLILIFVADAGITAWRRGDHRRALTTAGSVEFFLLAGLVTSSLVVWWHIEAPIVISPMYMGLVTVMGYELSRDVLRSPRLVRELQASEAGLRESEARMSLAVDAADFGLWIRHLARNEIWASEKWRELFGFVSSEPLEFDAILERMHSDDRKVFRQAHEMAVAGADGGRYKTEYRLMLADGTTRWIASQGRVECDAAGKPALIRGASRDVTARKLAEFALQTLSGRLLSAQEDERRLIARELHDNLSQQMALLSIEIERVALQTGRSPVLAQSMRELGTRTAGISSEIHSMSHRLHSAKLEALGLAAAVRGHCRELLALGLRVEFWEVDVPVSLSHDVQLCLFRIVQEGLNNVVKHSGASEAQVTLSGARDALLLTVADSGRGFDEAEAVGRDGLGLASMRERLRLIGGELTVRSRSGQGTTIDARAPLASPRSRSAGADVARLAQMRVR